jgi:hypothetical protein
VQRAPEPEPDFPPAAIEPAAPELHEEEPAPIRPVPVVVPAEPAARPESRAAELEAPVPAAAQEPPVEVRIGRVEVRLPSPPAEPRRRPRPRPRGFSGDSLARRYLDRRWY